MLELVWLIPALPLLAFLINGIFGGGILKDRSKYVAAVLVGCSFILAVKVFFVVKAGGTINFNLYTWISAGKMSVPIGFLVDPLSALMMIVVTTVSLMCHIYSIGYMHEDVSQYRFFSYLPLFTFAMLMLVLSNNFLQMFIFWEGVGLCSYLLIGYWYTRDSAASAGKKAFITTRIGDFGYLIALLILFVTFGTFDFVTVFDQASTMSSALITTIAVLFFLGAVGKSAQFPLHVWLPDAMEGPSPVSALIHAATMVTAGVYLVARAHPLYNLAPGAMHLVAVVGVGTACFAASMALVNNDLKRILAFCTISQLGYMFLACGVGAYVAGIFHLMTHAFFKALLFLAAGSVMHAMSGELDIRKMGGLYSKMKGTAITFIVASIAIAGIPPLSAFWSKDEILLETFLTHHTLLYVVGAVTAFMTAFYMFRAVFVVFFGESRVEKEVAHHVHESPASMLVPMVILAVLAAVSGLVASPLAKNVEGVPFIQHFLGRVLAAEGHGAVPHGSIVGLLMLVSVVIGVLGILVAWLFYSKKVLSAEKTVAAVKPVHTILINKYWMDELYDAIIINPLKSVSDKILWRGFDDGVIDGIVNGVAGVIRWIGSNVRRVHTGLVEDTVGVMVWGVVVVSILLIIL